MRIAFTADLHWGPHPTGDAATRQMVAFLEQQPPDLLVLAGDVGAGGHFSECLRLFAALPSRKALVPGNHDVWVERDDVRGDSLQVYQDYLPLVCAEHGFSYLDQGPLVFPEADLALVGSMNWYDYSWALEALQGFDDHAERLRTKTFTRGRHNDARFVRWPLDDVRFTAQVVDAFERHLQEALTQVSRAIVVTHHPPLYGLSFPRSGPPTTLDGFLWDAFTGNRGIETVLERQGERVPFVFCGHTHRAREHMLGAMRGFNIGGDYHFKRLLILEWPAGAVEVREFFGS